MKFSKDNNNMRFILISIILVFSLNFNFAYSDESLPKAVADAVDGFSRSLSQNIGTKVHFENISYIKTSFKDFYHITCKAVNDDGIEISSLEFYSDGTWITTIAPGAKSDCTDSLFSNMLFINLKTGFDESLFWKAEALKIPLKNITLTDDRIIFGASSAPVKVVLFTDFFCPSCYELSQGIAAIYKKYSKDVVVYFKHHPYSSDNPVYQKIALLYEQLYLKGLNIYTRLSREIRLNIAEHGNLNIKALNTTAATWLTGIPKNNFLKRYKNKRQFINKINTDYEEAQKLKLDKIAPICLVNGKLYAGCTPLLLDEAISREINPPDIASAPNFSNLR